MTKEKLLLIQGKEKYRDKLNKSIELFDESLNALINGDSKRDIIRPSNKKIKEQLQKIYDIWTQLKPLYKKDKLTKDELNKIIKLNPTLLNEINKMVSMAEKEREY
jgi:hypothetical protein